MDTQTKIRDALRTGDVRAFRVAIDAGRARGLTYIELRAMAIGGGFDRHAFEAMCQAADDEEREED